MSKTIVVGDVHGCLEELDELLKKCAYSPADRLIFVGDVIHKGPDSVGVLRRIQELGAEVVLGNHEIKFLQVAAGLTSASETMQRVLDQMGDDLEKWRQWIQKWPSYIEDEEFLVVHAGIIPDTPPSETKKEILANIRTWDGQGVDLNNETDPAWHDLYQEEKLIIYGHWAIQGLKVKDNSIGLDSGCVYGEKLSAIILPERKIVQVQARKTYLVPKSLSH